MPLQSDCRNRLLALMSAEDFARLAPDLEAVAMSKGMVLVAKDGLIDKVYFPESSITSIIATSPDGLECEAGIVGNDGFVPLSSVLGSDRSPHRIIVQVPDGGYRIARTSLTTALEDSPSLRNLLLRFVQVMTLQSGFTSLSNAVHPIDERLARWLLMSHDRYPSDDVPLTHEFLAIMLAVRRPSVTTALHVLEGNGFISTDRGCITIRNRTAMEAFARDAYGAPEAEYARLIGTMTPS